MKGWPQRINPDVETIIYSLSLVNLLSSIYTLYGTFAMKRLVGGSIYSGAVCEKII
jgi:hypothetical protein